jgi:hypothetical protein
VGDATTINAAAYVATDPFFGTPYIDQDEERTAIAPHRYLHGGFEGTGTRFSLYFPSKDVYRGRFIQPLEGGLGGSERSYDSIDGAMGALIGGFDFAIGLGAYMVETNQGHVGSQLCPKAGDDATVYAYRASAEAARFARYVALALYGEAPHHGYVFGGSGGSGRAAMCIENVYDVWDGALTFMGATAVPSTGAERPPSGAIFSQMYNAQRVLGEQLPGVVDALEPGGSGRPLEGLSSHQRQALFDLYKSGFPRGVEYMIAHPMGQIALWGWTAEQWYADDPGYYEEFWTQPGYVGHDEPQHVARDLIVDRRVTVRKTVTAAELGRDNIQAGHIVVGAEIEDVPDGYLQGCSVTVTTGGAAGRQLWCTGVANGNVLVVDGTGSAGNRRFRDVSAGDELVLDNRQYLAYCYRYRHVVDTEDPAQAHLTIDGEALYPQRPAAANVAPPHMGVYGWSGRYTGKVLTVQHTHDSSIWPRNHEWDEGADRWALRWLENAEHVPWSAVPTVGVPVPSTRLIDYKGAIEQSLHDLAAWVEEGAEPARTKGVHVEPGGPLRLPATAAERGGIQPVVTATANGASRADVAVGETVTLAVDSELPIGTGTVIALEWDFDGTGEFPFHHDTIDGTKSHITSSVTHAYAQAGTYFPSVRVTAHREGDLSATSRRVENLGRCRVVVT